MAVFAPCDRCVVMMIENNFYIRTFPGCFCRTPCELCYFCEETQLATTKPGSGKALANTWKLRTSHTGLSHMGSVCHAQLRSHQGRISGSVLGSGLHSTDDMVVYSVSVSYSVPRNNNPPPSSLYHLFRSLTVACVVSEPRTAVVATNAKVASGTWKWKVRQRLITLAPIDGQMASPSAFFFRLLLFQLLKRSGQTTQNICLELAKHMFLQLKPPAPLFYVGGGWGRRPYNI